MKAWEVRANALRLAEIDPPTPRAGESTVQTQYVGICGSDTPKLLRPSDFTLPDPWRPGHEIVGTDAAGHLVAVDPLVPCGGCQRCEMGDTHLCPTLFRIGWDEPGGFAEQVTAPAANLHAVPDGLDPLYAVLADPAAVAIHGIRCSSIDANARLAIVGSGTIALLTATCALSWGHAVTIVHRGGGGPPPATNRAVEASFRPPPQAPAGTFDVVVDAATGSDAGPLELALRLVRDGGTVVVQNAYYPEVRLRTPLRHLFRRSVRLVGSFSHCRRNHGSDFAIALAFLSDHPEQAHYLVDRVGTLEELGRVLTSRLVRHRRAALSVEPGGSRPWK